VKRELQRIDPTCVTPKNGQYEQKKGQQKGTDNF
jgi:hypothetical protein